MKRERPLSCANSTPQVVELFRLINSTDRKFAEIVKEAGFDRGTVYDWGRRQTPNVTNLEAVLNVLGYTLKIVPLGKDHDR